MEEKNLKKTQLCNWLLENNSVELYQVIRHSYSSHRMNENWQGRNKFINICPTLDTRYDCLGVVVKDERK